tara:strand:+ start:117 stop:224 length:108 start_codon:yes stop_codon:yes gene_type:complete
VEGLAKMPKTELTPDIAKTQENLQDISIKFKQQML